MKVVRIRPPLSPPQANLRLPGSKSFSNRALILAAQCQRPVEIIRPAEADDTEIMLKALEQFGCPVERGQESVRLSRPPGELPHSVTIDVGHAGTAMRFLTAYAAFSGVRSVILQGSARMHQRPIGPLVEALRSLGARIEYLGRDGYPPLLIYGESKQSHSIIEVSGELSSQFITALLLIGPSLPLGLTLSVKGALVSAPYVAMTDSVLTAFRVVVGRTLAEGRVFQPGLPFGTNQYVVEPDASGASYFWGIAALTGGTVGVYGLSLDSAQGDVRFTDLLVQMGCEREFSTSGEPVLQIAGPKKLSGGFFDLTEMPDVAQTLAVICAYADGDSTLSGLQTLRHKETDRITAVAKELVSLGIGVREGKSSLQITPAPACVSRPIRTYDDHRMAMSFALCSTRLTGLAIENPQVVTKSFPSFWKILESLGFEIEKDG